MKNTVAEGIGWGCSAALVASALALTGSCTLLGMSWLIKNNHMPKAVEDAAARLALASLAVSGASVVGGVIAGALSEEERLQKLLAERQVLVYSLKDEIRELKAKQMYSPKEYYCAIEARDEEIFTRGNTIRELRRELRDKEKSLKEWETWWDSIRNVDPSYDVAGCRGCRHFDGSKYEGNLLVCAMHPYGNKSCDDWEGLANVANENE